MLKYSFDHKPRPLDCTLLTSNSPSIFRIYNLLFIPPFNHLQPSPHSPFYKKKSSATKEETHSSNENPPTLFSFFSNPQLSLLHSPASHTHIHTLSLSLAFPLTQLGDSCKKKTGKGKRKIIWRNFQSQVISSFFHFPSNTSIPFFSPSPTSCYWCYFWVLLIFSLFHPSKLRW